MRQAVHFALELPERSDFRVDPGTRPRLQERVVLVKPCRRAGNGIVPEIILVEETVSEPVEPVIALLRETTAGQEEKKNETRSLHRPNTDSRQFRR